MGSLERLRRPLVFAGAAGLAFFSAISPVEAAFAYRKPLTIQGVRVSGAPHTNFPVLISLVDPNLRTTANGGRVTSANGYDMAFILQSTGALLDHEIERYDGTTGTLVAWVRIPSLTAANQNFFIYYGDPEITSAQNNPRAVWDSSFRYVYHLAETSGNPVDSTSNATVATLNPNGDAGAIETWNVTGQIGPALDLTAPPSTPPPPFTVGPPATDTHVSIADGTLAANSAFSLETWVKFDTLPPLGPSGWVGILTKNRDSGVNWIGIDRQGATGQATSAWQCCGSGPDNLDGTTVLAPGTWYHIAVTFNGINQRAIYVNGVAENTSAVATTYVDLALNTRIGDDSNGNYVDGQVDEARFSANVTRSAGWITTTYNSASCPSTSTCGVVANRFVVEGAEQVVPTNYRSIGDTTTPYSTGSVNPTTGSTIVLGTGTTWRTANRGRGDTITFGGFTGTILSVDSETQLTLVSPSTVTGPFPMHVINRKFADLDSWEDCIDGGSSPCGPDPVIASANFITGDRREVGIAYKDTPFVLTGDVFIQGSTTGATHTIHLTADQGNRHNGFPGAGVVVNANGPNEFSVRDSNVTVEWLEFLGCRGSINVGAVEVWAGGGDRATNVLLQNLLIHDFDDPGNDGSGIALSGDLVGGSLKSVTIRNTMIWDGDFYGIEGDNSADTALIENVSIDGMLDHGIWAGNSAFTIRNTIVTSSPTEDFSRDTSGSLTGSHNTDSDGTAALYFTNPLTASAASIFVFPNVDLHLKPGVNPAALDTGLDLSSSFGNDIDGQLRPAWLSWDRGADERDGATADLAITKDDGQASAVPGTSITYTITVTNNGPATVTGVTVIDTVPATILGPVFTPSAGAYNSGTGLWTGLTLAMGQSITLTLDGTIDPSATGTLENTVTVSPPAGMVDPFSANGSDMDTDTLTPQADVGLAKTDTPDPAMVGGSLTYTLTVTNNGPSTATAVVLTDPLPAGIAFSSSVPGAPTCTYNSGTRVVSCALGTLAPTASAVVTVVVTAVSAGAITNNASVTRFEADLVPANDTAAATTTVDVVGNAVRYFTVTSTSQKNLLEWLNPTLAAAPGYLSTQIVFKTTGFPASPADGTTLYDAGTAGTRDSFLHDTPPLTNGQAYYYAAFVNLSGPSVSAGRFNKGRPFLTSGPVKWAFSIGTTSLTPPGNGVGVVHAVANDNSIHAVVKGAGGGNWAPLPWRPQSMMGPSQGRPSGAPVAVGGAARVLFLGSQDGYVYAFDAESGNAAWTPSSPLLGDRVQAGPSGIFSAFGGAPYDYILVGTRNDATPNAFYALNLADGTAAPGWPFTGGPFGNIGVISGQAAVDYENKRVYFASQAYGPFPDDNTVWCVSLVDGSAIWAKPHGNVSGGVTLLGNRLYVGPDGGGVLALETSGPSAGDAAWTFPTGGFPVKGFIMADRLLNNLYFSTSNNRVFSLLDTVLSYSENWTPGGVSLPSPSTPVYAPGDPYVYVGGSGQLFRLNVGDGSTFDSYVLGGGTAIVGSPTIDVRNNFVYVGSEEGVIYAFQIP